jgi:hypothetical protein
VFLHAIYCCMQFTVTCDLICLNVALFEQEGVEMAQFEGRLNNTLVKTLADLDNLIKGMRGNYIPNSRVCKFLLSEQNLASLKRFLMRQSPHMLQQMYSYMIADGYPFTNALGIPLHVRLLSP